MKNVSPSQVGKKQLTLCSENSTKVGKNVSSFFGRMCCRSLKEFDTEQRCQYFGNYSQTGKRSKYTDQGSIIATYADGRVAVQLEDGCVQEVPHYIVLENLRLWCSRSLLNVCCLVFVVDKCNRVRCSIFGMLLEEIDYVFIGSI